MTRKDTSHNKSRRRLLTSLPLIGVGLGGYAFWKMLDGLQNGSFDPHAINTPIINRPIPQFKTEQKDGIHPFTYQDLKNSRQTILINFFASWCIPCLQESRALFDLRDKISIWGIAYKDRVENTHRFLEHTGNPYQSLIFDHDGKIGMEWGISGVPESFLIDPQGIIRWHQSTPIETNETNALTQLSRHLT